MSKKVLKILIVILFILVVSPIWKSEAAIYEKEEQTDTYWGYHLSEDICQTCSGLTNRFNMVAWLFFAREEPKDQVRVISHGNITGNGTGNPALYYYWSNNISLGSIIESTCVHGKRIIESPIYDYVGRVKLYDDEKQDYNTRAAILVNMYDSTLPYNADDWPIPRSILAQAYFLKQFKSYGKDVSYDQAIKVEPLNGEKDKEIVKILLNEYQYSEVPKKDYGYEITAEDIIKVYNENVTTTVPDIQAINEKRKNTEYMLSDIDTNNKDGEKIICSPGQTFYLQLQGLHAEGEKLEINNDSAKIECVDENIEKYEITVSEDFSEKDFQITIPYKYIKYYAHYDIFKKRNEEIYVVDPGEADPAVKTSVTIKFTIRVDVSINQYIYSVDGEKVEYLQKNSSGVWQIKNANSKGDRKTWSETQKKNRRVLVENGSKVVYKLTVENEQGKDVYVKLKDTLPGCCEEIEVESNKVDDQVSLSNGPIESEDWPGVETRSNTDNRKTKGYLKVSANSSITFTITTTVSGTAYNTLRTATAEIENVKLKVDATKTHQAKKAESSDHFRIKEYNVAIDTYIEKVDHQESQLGTLTTYNSDARKSTITASNGVGNQDNTKTSNPVFVEYGDRVTYKIRIYNTTDDTSIPEYDIGDKAEKPYRNPGEIYVNIEDTLPANYSGLTVEGGTYTVNKTKLNITNVNIPKNTYREVTVSFIVEDVTRDTVVTNTAKITKIENKHNSSVKNNSERTTASDYYKLNDYNASLEQYIFAYDAKMQKYNNDHGFTNEEDKSFVNATKSYPASSPLEVEKYETLTFVTKVKNDASANEAENTPGTYAKYNTRVRPSIVNLSIGSGLDKIGSTKIEWYNANGTLKRDITGSVNVLGNNYEITDDSIILSPGEYLLYTTNIKVKESNLCLQNIGVSSTITKLTNINKNTSNERNVTEQNIASKKADADYVKLKNLVIAGNVWVDGNRNGTKDETDGKNGVTVKLYKVDQREPVATTTTNANGFYTFGRQAKADSNNNYYQYYVEFEYDGVKYKATEVYGGDSDGQADGMQNLGGKSGSSTWRQGYSDLPDATSGKTEYMTDSNAYEFDDIRNTFENEYQTIGFNKSYKGTSPNMDLAYTKNGHVSILNENSNRVMTARSFITQDYETEINNSLSNTNTLFLQGYAGYSNQNPETEYLKFINLGLVEREQVDISIESDVYSVKNTINGEEMTYDFYKNDADSTANDYKDKAPGEDNAYKLNQAYNLNLYQADYNYRYDNYYQDESALQVYKQNTSELTTEITYRIKIHNNKIENDEPNTQTVKDVPVETAINEIAIYYNKNLVELGSNSEVEHKTKKTKNAETGLFEDTDFATIRANYGTESELDNLVNRVNETDTRIHISLSSKYGNPIPTDSNMSDYNVLYLTGDTMTNTYIPEGETRYIQITFTVDKDTARNLKLTQEDMGFEVVSEVSAYTTKYSDTYAHKGLAGKYAGLVDRDSNPGNLHLNGIEDYNNYEDDKYKVGITIKKFDSSIPTPDPNEPNPGTNPGTRSITGIVWEDARTERIQTEETGIQYIGDGIRQLGTDSDQNAQKNVKYDTQAGKEKVVSGVKVSLIEVVQTEKVDENGNAIYYEYPARDSEGNLIEMVTDENGKYTLTDFIPGYYKVRFDYGYDETRDDNILYNGQDYKSTQYYNEDGNDTLYYEGKAEYKYNTDNIGSANNFNYFDKVRDLLRKPERSDAQDDEIRRLNVNSYSETMTTTEAQVFSEPNSHKEELTKNTHMHAETAIFYVNPENVDASQKNIDASDSNFDKTRLWNIQNLDFGLEYRPEASIILDKNLSTVELVTSDNKSLIKLYFTKDEAGKISIDKDKSTGYQNVQFLPNNQKETQGFAYINMDSDILEGCTIKVEYTMDASNQSEVDRINENLYQIRYASGGAKNGYTGVYYSNNYNANGTAAESLSQKYYYKNSEKDYYDAISGKEVYDYLKKIKKPYKVSNQNEKGTEYYGMYLGQTYYMGKIGNKDCVAQLKVDHILDYIDNDFTFNLSENNTRNKLWQTTTSEELRNQKVLDFTKVYVDNNRDYHLIDKDGIRYDTENRSNLALSVDDNKNGRYEDGEERNGNVSLSRFLTTNQASREVNSYTGTISALASKVLSADDITKGTGLSYENISEIVQYTSLTGRRTTLPDDDGGGGIIANANVDNWVGYDKYEDDTDATELITIAPPTGLDK